MTLRMVAGLRSPPASRASVREPTGWPSRMYRSTSTLRKCWARSPIAASEGLLPGLWDTTGRTTIRVSSGLLALHAFEC